MANSTINTDKMKFDMLVNPTKINQNDENKNIEIENILETTSVKSETTVSSIHEIELPQEPPQQEPSPPVEFISATPEKKIFTPSIHDNESVVSTHDHIDCKIKKIELLRIFTEYKKRGFELSQHFDINSNLNEMEAELNILKSQRSKQQALKISQGFLINAVQTFEFLNSKYDPLGMDLVGFSEVVSVGITEGSYDDVLDELYEKYKHVGRKVEPEIKLVLMLGASAASYHTSKRLVGKVAGSEEPLNRNPEFVNNINKMGKSFVNSMDEQNKKKDDIVAPSVAPESNKRRELLSKIKR